MIADNQDRDLRLSDPDTEFWDRVRLWQRKGWSIALHGFRHQFHPIDKNKQLLPFHDRSEFAGLGLDQQRQKIRQAIKIFEKAGVNATLWVAPAHSFDHTTLEALTSETNIRTISDGISLLPFKHRGFNFIPQQTWQLKKKILGSLDSLFASRNDDRGRYTSAHKTIRQRILQR